jgi:hypothetical protein
MARVQTLWRGPLGRRFPVAVLFLLSLVFFVERGPYRALWDGRTGDFATIYAAARCWVHRENPYAEADLRLELNRAGAPAPLILEQDRHVSAYPISLMPLVAALAWLPWHKANVTWCLLSLGCFAASLVVLLQTFLSLPSKIVAASCCLFFSPTYVGVLNGNPSVIAISLAILSLHSGFKNRLWTCGLLFGATLCIKPQIALCGFLAFLLWRRWRPLFIGFAAATLITTLAAVWVSSFGQDWTWWESLKQNAASLALPGSLIDPRPSSPYASGFLNAQTLSYLLTPNAALAQGLVLLLTAGMLALYFFSRKRDALADRRIDSAFLAAITLEVGYHRYYDAQLLLVLIPAIAYLWQIGRVRTAWALGLCFALAAFPLQSLFAKAVEPAAMPFSLAQFLLFRHEPMAILAAALILSALPTETKTSEPAAPGGPKPIRYAPHPRLP